VWNSLSLARSLSHSRQDYKIIFLLSDPFWLIEQWYCLNRSLQSLQRKLKLVNEDLSPGEQWWLRATSFCDDIVQGKVGFLTRRKNPSGYDFRLATDAHNANEVVGIAGPQPLVQR
jgi:hypothetical protein